MLVAEILKSKGETVYSVEPQETLEAAARRLDSHRVGALVVCEADRVIGIFSERDLVRAVARGGAAALTQPAREHMTADVQYAAPTETIDSVMGRMTDRRIRHLPVLNAARLSGIVSIGDVVKCKIAEATFEAESMKSYIVSG